MRLKGGRSRRLCPRRRGDRRARSRRAFPMKSCRASPRRWPSAATPAFRSRRAMPPRPWRWSPVTSATTNRLRAWTIRPWRRSPARWCFTWASPPSPIGAQQLLAAGKPAQTPAAIVRRCSWPDQETIPCTLGTVAATVAGRRLRPPALVVVGPVAALKSRAIGLLERPLFGTRVLATRPRTWQTAHQRAGGVGRARGLQPAIEIGPPDDWGPWIGR